jgi:membrane protein DedA with SNARE-associated domain
LFEGILHLVGMWISNQISAMGYAGVAAMMAIESACIPLPSEIIMPFSGYLVFAGRFNFHITSFAGAFGCAVGSAVAYYAGMHGGRPFLFKYGKYLLIFVIRTGLSLCSGWIRERERIAPAPS